MSQQRMLAMYIRAAVQDRVCSMSGLIDYAHATFA
jgi:hypothetical protein